MNNIEGPLALNKESDKEKKTLSKETSSRTIAIAANLLHGKNQTPEALGHLVVNNERNPKSIETNEINKIPISKVDTLNRADILKLSEQIEIDGTSLRQIYETKLLGENGLRRLIKEYISGGDLQKALKFEIMERDKDFERDPIMRDMASSTVSSNSLASNNSIEDDQPTDLASLIKKAEKSLPVDQEEESFYKAKTQFELKSIKSQQKQLRRIDALLITIISVLTILVIIIFISRT